MPTGRKIYTVEGGQYSDEGMENPKTVTSSFFVLLVGLGVLCLGLAVYRRYLYPLVAYGIMRGALGIFSVVVLVVNAIFVFPLMLLLGKIFDREKSNKLLRVHSVRYRDWKGFICMARLCLCSLSHRERELRPSDSQLLQRIHERLAGLCIEVVTPAEDFAFVVKGKDPDHR